jgi:hypothetical protein
MANKEPLGSFKTQKVKRTGSNNDNLMVLISLVLNLIIKIKVNLYRRLNGRTIRSGGEIL